MKTSKVRRMISVVAMMGIAMVSMAGTPLKLYNDEVMEGKVTIREVCCKTADGYERSVRSELIYLADGILESKNIYRWDAAYNCWMLSKSYLYLSPSEVELVAYDRHGKIAYIHSNKDKSL